MRVVILMSTYNGERFIEEQVASILQQLPPEGLLMIRDDGSSDRTVALIRSFQDTRIRIEEGSNIGFAKSFLTLLVKTPANTQMAMFSDQDDVWLEDKVQRAWDCLSTVKTEPALYCCRQIITDAGLRVLDESPKMNGRPSFHNALAENIVTGCTAAINQRALDLLKRSGVPERVMFHDWWLYLVVSAHGTVIADDNAFIFYRQHENNFIGRGVGKFGRLMKNFDFLMTKDWPEALIGQMVELRTYYMSSLTSEQQEAIEKFVEFSGCNSCARLAFILHPSKWIEDPLRDFFLRLLLLTHRIRKKLSTHS